MLVDLANLAAEVQKRLEKRAVDDGTADADEVAEKTEVLQIAS